MYRAFELDSKEDLSGFSRLLWQRKISHLIQRNREMQVLAVANPDHVPRVLELFQQWQRGEVELREDDFSGLSGYFNTAGSVGGVLRAFATTPLSLSTVFLCLVLALLTLTMGNEALRNALMYPDFAYGTRFINLDRVLANFGFGEFVRMITPILLHGSYVHLAFNMLWFWEFGKRIEAVQSSWTLLAVIIIIALISNTTQYLLGGGNNFLGMSGVVYGLLAYIWMWQLFDPRKGLGLPAALIFIMVAFLVVLSMIDLAIIADEAHIAGLLCGVVIGAVLATLSRIKRAVKTADTDL